MSKFRKTRMHEASGTKKDPLSSKGGGHNIKIKGTKGRDGDRSRKESLLKEKRISNIRKHSLPWVCGQPWNLRGQNKQEEKLNK